MMELLLDILSRLACLEDKVEHVAERVEDLIDDYVGDCVNTLLGSLHNNPARYDYVMNIMPRYHFNT